ncbi:hypothetical protein sos41_39980 [Alphaproteobacteria bacterium SO-S41]|nr:hypothetical protein sos41_39980 [Alphaproteobacteria bacterium SO-S41]
MTFYRRTSLAWFALSLIATGPALAADFTVPTPATRAADAGLTLTAPRDVAETEGQDIAADVDAAFALADQFPAERYELAPLAKTFGQDARAAFTWVRDTIRFDPYAGHLRDGEGVLAASGGNAYDRALLLKGLLEAMGVKARLAHATLDDAAQTKLKAAVFAPRGGVPVPSAQPVFKTDFTDRLRARAGRDFALLTTALGSDALAAMETTVGVPALPLADHLWVQAEIDGAWVDLDTSLADAAPGDTLAPADATPEAIDPAASQIVTLSVSATLSSGEQKLLTATLPAADAANSQILLYFEPKKDGIGGAIAGGGGYLPVLVVNGAETKGEPIAATDNGGAVGGAIDALGGGGDDEAVLQAITLKIVTEAPGEAPIEMTRILAAAAADGAMATDDHGIVAMRWVHHVMISNGGQSPRAFAILKAASMDYAVRALSSETQLGDLTLTELLWPTTSANLALPTASERLFVEALNTPGTRAFVGRPRVFIASTGARAGGDGTLQGFDLDLALDGVSVVTEAGMGGAAGRFWYGVLEAALETEYGLLRLAAMMPDGRDVLGASLAIDSAPLTVIGAGVEIADAPQTMKKALAAGGRVIVAGDPAAAKVWWTIQPDGTSRAVLDPSLGGLTGGGGYYRGGSYVNSSGGGPRYIIDSGGNTVGEVRNGRDMMYRTAPRAGGRCGGGQEYITLLGCVSIPVAVGIGILAGAVIVASYGSIAVTIIRAL